MHCISWKLYVVYLCPEFKGLSWIHMGKKGFTHTLIIMSYIVWDVMMVWFVFILISKSHTSYPLQIMWFIFILKGKYMDEIDLMHKHLREYVLVIPYAYISYSMLMDKHFVQLTHWGRATHICVGKLTTIGSDNGLWPGRRQAIIGTIAGILLIRPLGTKFSEILIRIQTFSFKKMHLKMLSAKWRPFVSASMC